MRLPLFLALCALPLLSVFAHAQDPDLPLIDDLSPDRKASAETRQTPPRSPKQPAAGAAANNKPGIPGDSDRPGDSVLGEMPKDLNAAVSRALQRNPQILIADAKVRQAQAELNEAKFKVIREVTAAFRTYAHYKQGLADVKNSNGPNDDMRRQIQNHLESSELDLIYLLGVGAESSPSPPGQEEAAFDEKNSESGSFAEMRGAPPRKAPAGQKADWFAASQKRPRAAHAIPKALRPALGEKTVMDFTDQSLGEITEYLAARHNVQFIKQEKQIDVPVTCSVRDVTLAAALQAIADLTNYCFVFRDYGILVVKKEAASSYMKNHVPMIAPGEASLPMDDAGSEPESPYRAPRY